MYSITYLAPGASAETPVYRAGDFLGAFDCRRAVYTTGVNAVWSLALTIGPGNPAYDEIEIMRGEFRVRDGDELVFRGRPWRVSRTLDGAINVDIEGLLAVLSDVEFSAYQFSASGSDSVTAFLNDLLITKFNPYMTSGRKIALGTISVTSPAYTIAAVEPNPLSAWAILTQYTAETLGGYLLPDYSSLSQIKLHYLAELPAAGQDITLAQNLIDFEAEHDGSNLITHLFPRGKDGLTINSIPNGTYSGIGKQGAYLYDAAARDKYGSIVRYIDFNELETAQDVFDAGLAVMLAQAGKFVESITVSAVDLSLSSEAFVAFKAGTMVTVREQLGQEASYPLAEMSVDLVDPAQSTITLNNTLSTLSSSGVKGGNSGGGTIIGSGVTGVKGSAETSYRSGNVNLTKANIGLGNVDNVKQLPITGGTLTGYLSIQSDNLEAGTAPGAGTSGRSLRLVDKNSVTLASIYPYISANGRVSILLSPRLINEDTGATVYNELQLGVNPDGSRMVYLSDPAAWRSALGLDTVPTLDSNKLVTSGGVYAALDDESSARQAAIKALRIALDDKQDALTAGANISISGATISATADAAVTASSTKLITSGAVAAAIEDEAAARQSAIRGLQAALDDKQDLLTAGDNIAIAGDVISATGLLKLTGGTMSGTLWLNNNIWLQSRSTAGSGLSLIGVNANNVIGVGSSGYPLRLHTSGGVTIPSPNIEIGETPASGKQGRYIRFTDKDDATIASVYPYISANGRANIIISPRLTVDGATVYNELQLGVNPDGTRLVSVSESAPWRRALGLGNVDNVKQLPITGGTLTGALDLSDGAGKVGLSLYVNETTGAGAILLDDGSGGSAVFTKNVLDALWAKQDALTAGNNISISGATISATADAAVTASSTKLITSGAVAEALDALPCVGVNRLLDTGTEQSIPGGSGWRRATYYLSAYGAIQSGGTYTLTVNLTPGAGLASLQLNNSAGLIFTSPYNIAVNGSGRQTASMTFTATKDESDHIRLYAIPTDGTNTGDTTIHWIKLESGSKATDWTPAPEELLAAPGGIQPGPIQIGKDGSTVKALIRETDDGRGNVQLFHADGTLAVNIYPTSSGGEIDLLNASGQTRAALFIAASGAGALRLYGNDGTYASLTKENLEALLAKL